MNAYSRSDAEAADPGELRRQKRKKYLIYFAAFVVFQTAIIVLFTLTVMKVKTPKFRVRSSSSINTVDVPQTNTTSFTLNAQFGVKNTNFGPYKYDNTTVNFLYNGIVVGSAFIPKSKANFLSTKKINVQVELTSANLSGNTLNLTSTARLSGKVELMLIFKKKKAVNMNCTMVANTSTQMLENIKCK
ncbi:hypothetical protein C3L33_03284, partial [Rhododendron williamsianum]